MKLKPRKNVVIFLTNTKFPLKKKKKCELLYERLRVIKHVPKKIPGQLASELSPVSYLCTVPIKVTYIHIWHIKDANFLNSLSKASLCLLTIFIRLTQYPKNPVDK